MWWCSSVLFLNWVPNLLMLIGCIYIHVHATTCCYWWKYYYTTNAYFSIMPKTQAGFLRNPGLTHSSGVQTSSVGPASHTICTTGSLRGKVVKAWSCKIHLHLVPSTEVCLHPFHAFMVCTRIATAFWWTEFVFVHTHTIISTVE